MTDKYDAVKARLDKLEQSRGNTNLTKILIISRNIYNFTKAFPSYGQAFLFSIFLAYFVP
jgi:hypothetical protein